MQEEAVSATRIGSVLTSVRARILVPLVLGPLFIVGVGIDSWQCTTTWLWIDDVLATLAAAGFLDANRTLFDMPTSGRVAFRVLSLAVLVSVVRVPGLPFGKSNWTTYGLAVSCTYLVAPVLIGFCRERAASPAVLLAPPFAEGTWVVLAGGGTKRINHHLIAQNQQGAIDLVRLGPNGAKARVLRPRAAADFAAYGAELVAPCDGVIVRAADGLPDQVPGPPVLAPPYGNHVTIDTGTEHVVLAHMQPGSVQVREGDNVTAGQPIGRVGNSGRSFEPHLHLHAERDGVGVRLRFRGVKGPLARGRKIVVG